MKRIFALFLSALLALALAGCGGETTTSASGAAPTAAPPASEQSESAS